MQFNPTFTNIDDSGLRTDVNGFEERDYARPGDEYTEPQNWRDSPRKLPDLEEEDLEELTQD